MGTHSAMVVRSRNGLLERYERTLDGDSLTEEFVRWVRTLPEGIEEYPNPRWIGNGLEEIGNEGEAQQEYYLILNTERKLFELGGIPWNRITLDAVQHLIENGWDFFDRNKIQLEGEGEDYETLLALDDPTIFLQGEVIPDE